MANDKDHPLTPNDCKLEGYKDLSRWNIHDYQTMIVIDKFLLTASVGACVASLTRFRGVYHFIYFGSAVVLTYWIILSFQCRMRVLRRLSIMLQIENDLGFQAHTEFVYSNVSHPLFGIQHRQLPRDITMRTIFYVSFIVVMFPLTLKWLGKNLEGVIKLLQLT